MSATNMLDGLIVVMVETTLPANIGSAARAMMTAGLSHLTIVNPKLPIDETSYAHAKGGSTILENTIITPTLADAVADCQLIFACSSRNRHLPRPVVTPFEAAAIIDGFVNSHTNHQSKIALLFGREDRGLTNDELAIAHYHLQINANPAYPVLNVANSIQVIASFFYDYFINQSTPSQHHSEKLPLITHIRQEWDEPAICFADTQKLEQAVLELFVQLKLADDKNLAHLPNRLARLSNRVQLDKKEYALLMALIHKLKQTSKNTS